MKNIQTSGFWFLVLIAIIAFIWSFDCTDEIRETYQYDPANIDLDIHNNCRNPIFTNSQVFLIQYPGSIAYGQWKNLIIKTMPQFTAETIQDNNLCDANFEIYLDLENSYVEPGIRISQSISGFSEHVFIFRVSPIINSGKLSGDLWIYINQRIHEESQFTSIPMLVIPIQINVKNFFGIPSMVVRKVAIASLLIAFVIKFFSLSFKKDQNDIIGHYES